jgi:SAM-dependent methyltransferase
MTNPISALSLHKARIVHHADEAPLAVTVDFSVDEAIAFDVDISLDIHRATGEQVSHSQMRTGGCDAAWLPRGSYIAHAMAPRVALEPGNYVAQVALWFRDDTVETKAGAAALPFEVTSGSGAGPNFSWQLESSGNTPPVSALSWQRAPQDWFGKHFQHAALTITNYLLGDSELLKGRILDVGCGDGITDLGIALRKKPLELVGIDPFPDFERLPTALSDAGLSPDIIPKCLRFLPADANQLPFPDDHFDVVLSWGSVEHMAGGYARALREMRRVLRPDGLLMIAPGLYYSDVGNHLGEFKFAQREPYVHLKRSREWLREQVMRGEIDRMDRSGWEPSMEQYWQFFTELNPITVPEFERELRELGFEPWRVAMRTHDLVEYTPELQKYSFVDLAVGELHLSAYNRKHRL